MKTYTGKIISYLSGLIFGVGLVFVPSNSNFALQNQQSGDYIRTLAWKPNGNALAVAGVIEDQFGIYLIDDITKDIASQFQTGGSVLTIAWSPDGAKLAALVSGEVNEIQIWDVNNNVKTSTISQEGATTTNFIAWNPDSTRLAFVRQLTLTVWSEKADKLTLTVENAEQIQAFAWSINGNQIFIAGADQLIRVWDLTENRIVSEYKSPSFPVSLAFNKDGTKLAIGGSDGTVQILDAISFAILSTLQAPNDALWYLTWSADGNQIAVAGSRNDITIWETTSGQLLDTVEKQTAGFLQAIAFSPYGGRLAYSTNPFSSGSPSLEQTTFNDYTEKVLDGAIQIAVPAPSTEKLQSITKQCDTQSSIEQSLDGQISSNSLQSFTDQVSQLDDSQIAPGCKADLLAVANALMAQSQ